MQVALAYAALAYIMASFLYLAATKLGDVGTPLKDSYTDEQLVIKAASSKKRGTIFAASVACSFAILALWQPF